MARGKKEQFKRNVMTRYMRNNIKIVVLLIFFVMTLLAGYLYYINSNNGDKYAKLVLDNQQYDSTILPFKRGDIRDRNGTILAYSTKVYNLILDPKVMMSDEGKYLEATVDALVQCFDLTRQQILEILDENPNSHYKRVIKGLSGDEIAEFVALTEDKKNNPNINGVWFEEEYVRNYPFDSLACDVIGFASSANSGELGIENYYNDVLTGVDGVDYGYVDESLNLETIVKPAVDGYNVITTLDFSVQSIIERHIAEFNENYGSKNIAVIVMDPNNGEIIAEASAPAFNLNSPRDLTAVYTEEELELMSDEDTINALYQLWRNFCVSDIYEPGSTIKPFTVASGLEEGLLNGTEVYECDGSEIVQEETIHCHNRWGHGTLTLQETIMQSCNDALMQISTVLGASIMSKYQNIFGFGQKTNIDLPGEEAGLLIPEENMQPIDMATNSFGQNMNVNMTQMVAAFASLINGGYYYQPHVVKRVETSSGEVVKTYDATLVKRTVTESTSATLREYMYQTVLNGTASKVSVEGYQIGGKTGTAQKQPRSEERYVISFLGFAPVDDPQFVIYVVIDEPQVEAGLVGSSSPVVRLSHDILQDILPYLNVFPVPVEEPQEGETQEEPVDIDEVNNGAITE